jgi:membrane protein YdbS with pleckstrin-like domain
MPRLIEIAMFLTPFVAFAIWQLAFPSASSGWMTTWAAAAVLIMMLSLFWYHHQEVDHAEQRYVPAQLQDGRIVHQPP